MKTMSITDARKLLTTLDTVTNCEPVAISRGGTPTMVVVSPVFFDKAIEALEDVATMQLLDEHRANPEPTSPWEEFAAEMGWSRDDLSEGDIAIAREILGYVK